MKKAKLLSLFIVTLLILTACGKDPFTADVSYQPQEVRQKNEKLLKEYLEKYEKAGEESEKSALATEVGFFYLQLGNYRQAIKYYEEVIQYDAVHFPALNNLAYMYEEAGDFEKALEYEKRLYEANPTNREVVSDTIRILVENKRFDEATGVLEAFSRYDKSTGNNYTQFIGDQYSYIFDEQQKQTTKQ